jgi:UDP-N-acetylmuramoylalanine--D-glutamate ligase
MTAIEPSQGAFKNLDDLVSWHADWRGLRVAVLGLGVTGFSVADTFAELGADVLVIAEQAEADQVDILDVLGVPHIIGPQVATEGPELVAAHKPQVLVVSPGVPPQSPIVVWAVANSVAVWVDVELAWRLRDKTEKIADWILVTGTNGKTTTTQLVEAMLTSGGLRAAAGGNIGTPMLDLMRDPIGFDAVVVELSSFQLHYLSVPASQFPVPASPGTTSSGTTSPGQIVPLASVCLNLADDHLDWHGNFESYSKAKAKVYEQTKVACVYNVQDSATESMVENANVTEGARAIGFTLGAPGLSQVGYVEDILADRAFLEDRKNAALEIATLADIENIGVITPHLLANVAAATALARAAGVEPFSIREAIRGFRLDAHRIELVGEWGGIRWFDDSKATNPHAAAASLASFESVIWVVGGLLKGVDIRPLVKRFKAKLRGAIVIRIDQQPVLDAFAAEAPSLPLLAVAPGSEKSSDDAARVMRAVAIQAHAWAQSGDVVLLAPAAASMDQFVDYADRGTAFSEATKWVND